MNSSLASAPRFAAAVSNANDAAVAAREACRQARDELGAKPNLAMVFASFQHQEQFASLASQVDAELSADCLLGCTGESILCNDREWEETPTVAVWLAHLPGVELTPIELDFRLNPDGGTVTGWPNQLSARLPPGAALLMLAEPFSFPADVVLHRLADEQPGVPVIGGMASGGWSPGQNRLMLGGRTIERGAVAVLLHGAVRVRTVVSQGCRPIGRPFVITKAERNVIEELGGRPALAQLQELFQSLTTEEQQLARQGLHVGRVINEYQEQFARGDFLVRNLQGVDPEKGVIAVGDYVRVGQTVQFHVRDANTANEDLNLLLDAARSSGSQPAGGLVFTCNGRGNRLFDAPHHDATAVRRRWPGIATAGFFAQGEIGPIGGRNFVHGFTASIALFDHRAAS